MIIKDIQYSDISDRCTGDLFLPEKTDKPVPLTLVIHGGGWLAWEKSSLAPLAELLRAKGAAVFSINYRLLWMAPWPACEQDSLAAARFMLNDGLAEYGDFLTNKIMVAGASAGGHLAMMTGLKLDREQVQAIISISGPADLNIKVPVTREDMQVGWPKLHAIHA